STYCQAYAEEKGKNIDFTHCSSYGPNPDKGVSFVAPGNGIPIIHETSGGIEFKYGRGTSFSAPLFAGMVLIALYAFTNGWFAAGGTPASLLLKIPMGSQIDDIFKSVSSRSSWDMRMGWGYVHLQQLYQYAYELGRNSVPQGGGGSGSWQFLG
ncbi:MAG: hypothetical protein D6732_13485, partial [Methanobacteriota archaeon]